MAESILLELKRWSEKAKKEVDGIIREEGEQAAFDEGVQASIQN